jgi:type I restriction enzyme, S subunit
MAGLPGLPIDQITSAIIDYRGKTPTKTTSGVKLITAKVIKGGFIRDEEHEYIAEDEYDAWMRRGLPKQWDILLTTEAPLGEVAQLRSAERVALAQRVILLRGDPATISQSFLFHALKSDYVQSQLYQRSSGTTVLGIKQSELRKVLIPCPPMPMQTRIADILSAYDDLIVNNTRRIAILEEMARSLFREWFVNFRFPGHEEVSMADSPLGPIPNGWTVVSLKDVVELRHDNTSPGDHLSNRQYVPIDCLPQRSLILHDSRPWTEAKSSLQLFDRDDILFGAMRAYFHKVVLAPFDGITRTTCFVLRPRREAYRSFVTMLMDRDDTVAYASAHSQGATIPYAVWRGSLADMGVVLPDLRQASAFHDVVWPMLQWIASSFDRQRILRETRDLLLRRLISGEIDVEAAEGQLVTVET